MLTLQALAYDERNNRTGWPSWNYVTGILTTWKGSPKLDRVIKSTAGKCVRMQVVNQSDMGSFNNQRTKMSLLSDEL